LAGVTSADCAAVIILGHQTADAQASGGRDQAGNQFSSLTTNIAAPLKGQVRWFLDSFAWLRPSIEPCQLGQERDWLSWAVSRESDMAKAGRLQ